MKNCILFFFGIFLLFKILFAKHHVEQTFLLYMCVEQVSLEASLFCKALEHELILNFRFFPNQKAISNLTSLALD